MVEVREETESRCWGYVSKERIFQKKKKLQDVKDVRLNGAKSLPNHAGERLLNDIKTIHSH